MAALNARPKFRVVRRSLNTGRVLRVIADDSLFKGDPQYAATYLEGFGKRSGCSRDTTNSVQCDYGDGKGYR